MVYSKQARKPFGLALLRNFLNCQIITLLSYISDMIALINDFSQR